VRFVPLFLAKNGAGPSYESSSFLSWHSQSTTELNVVPENKAESDSPRLFLPMSMMYCSMRIMTCDANTRHSKSSTLSQNLHHNSTTLTTSSSFAHNSQTRDYILNANHLPSLAPITTMSASRNADASSNQPGQIGSHIARDEPMTTSGVGPST